MYFIFKLSLNQKRNNIQLSISEKDSERTYLFDTPLIILPENWDAEKQRPINIYKKKDKEINKILNAIKIQLYESILTVRKNNNMLCQKKLTKLIYKICRENTSELPPNSLLHYMVQYISYKKDLICHSTYKRYMVFYHMVELYEGEVMERLNIDTINSEFVSNFIRFGKREKYSSSTLYRTIHFVKTILNFAERRGIRTRVREIEIRKEKQHTEIITLNEQEILQIRQTTVPKELQPAKDWLLISCYTGQRFSDFMQFDIKQMRDIQGKTCLFFTQKKTKKDIMLPLHPEVVQTIGNNSNEFPKPMTMQDYNEQIRKIAKISNLKNMIKTRKRIGFRTLEIEVEKWETITSHIGRRSFATNFYGKIPTPLLMEATGHSTEQMFLRYINPVDNERILSLGSFFDKMHKDLM